jgi:hypothetical protein
MKNDAPKAGRDVAVAALVAATALVWPSVSSAQARAAIDSTPACPSCQIALQLAATLTGPEVLGEPKSMVRMQDGRFIVAFYPMASEVFEFDATGKFTRLFARTGRGPGEVTRASAIHRTDSDTILIFDSGRVLRFNPAGEFVNAVQFPAWVERVIDSGSGSLVINGRYPVRDAVEQPLHEVDRAWRITSSFGAIEGVPLRPDLPYQAHRLITPDGSGGFWAVRRTAYELQRWTSSGELVQTWIRDADWFAPYEERRAISPDRDPENWVTAIHALDSVRVLVFVQIPQRDWRNHLGPARTTPSGLVLYPEWDVANVFDTRIELVDVVHGRVMTTIIHPSTLYAFSDEQYVSSYRQDESGTPFVDVWRLQVTTR